MTWLAAPVFRAWIFVSAAFLALAAPAATAEPTPEQARFFETKVRPVLVERCFGCHSESMKKHKGGLVVDSLGGLLQGGDSGPAVVPGHPEKSPLIDAVRYGNEDLQMPPKGKLSDAEIETLTGWVKMGAPWPNAGKTAARPAGKITDEDRKWWAFQPVKGVEPPNAGDGWARTPVDRFVAAKHAAAKLTPAPEADRTALIRRVTFDLTGLPPAPEEVEEFVNDTSATAYEKVVDRLLASPRYGERWARHWLDLVRYADSDGYRADDYRPNAWRYRDYVIRSFNADKSYDRFVKEQLAGDELYPGDPDARVATGYLRHWIYEYNSRDAPGQWDIILTDITDTTGDVFLGLGLQCARCHDHKFDPILQKDYFRLRAFFAALMPRDDLIATSEAERAEHAAKLKAWEEKTAALRKEIEAIEAPHRAKAQKYAIGLFPEDVQAVMAKPADRRAPYEKQLAYLVGEQVKFEIGRMERNIKGAEKERWVALTRELAKLDTLKPPPLPVAQAATDLGPDAPPTVIPKRDEPVEPGFLTILDEKPAAITPLPNSTGRRAALANWLASPDNPLTARVIVNRVWQQHFGRGLAANASDFGKLGDQPTHPELFDWLAADFVKNGWSLKRLHRLIVTSATYRQSATHLDPKPGRLADPENRLLWRGGVRRLDAEQIRDALFTVAGDLDLTTGGPGVPSSEPRRSVYTKIMRNVRDPLLDVFDAPLWFSSASSRDTTTTPVQSLLLINSQLMLKRAKAFAARLERDEPSNEGARIARAYRLAFGRRPTTEEVAAAQSFLAEQAKRIDPERAGSAAAAFASAKMPARDGQAADMRTGAGFPVPHAGGMPGGDFTIEAVIYPRSIADTGTVRTVAAKWSGDLKQPGWAFGVSGKGSRRKPQTLALQLVGAKAGGGFGEEAVFADHTVPLNKPCYVAAAVTLATDKQPGQVAFYLKDLGNDDEPLLAAKVKHTISGGLENTVPLTLGGRGPNKDGGFDGLLDDVRLSDGALTADQLMLTLAGPRTRTVGFWGFEPKPGVFADASGRGHDIRPAATSAAHAREAAWADLCHVLLNASEFLYVE